MTDDASMDDPIGRAIERLAIKAGISAVEAVEAAWDEHWGVSPVTGQRGGDGIDNYYDSAYNFRLARRRAGIDAMTHAVAATIAHLVGNVRPGGTDDPHGIKSSD